MTRIQLRRGSAATWTSANPTLEAGEVGVETDTGKAKIGTGSTAWTSLPYFSTWATLTGRPAVVAAGATAAEARTAIDAEYTANKAQANGYASLDSNGKVPGSQLPNSIMTYEGLHNVSTNTPALSDATGDAGAVYRVSVDGTRDYGSGNITLDVGDYLIYSGSAWQKADTTDAVSTVAGRTGNVTLTKSDVSLDQVDNTSDATKNAATVTLTNKTLTSPTLTTPVLGTPSSGNLAACVGQVADLSIVVAASQTTRATGTNDFPFGIKLQRAITFTAVHYRCATADASGNLVVELRKNGVAVSGSAATIAAASQVAGGSATGSWAFAAGDVITVQVTGVGTTPGKGLIADVAGLTS